MVDRQAGALSGHGAHLCVPISQVALGLCRQALLEAEEIVKCFPEVAHKPVDREVEGGVDDLEELH